jgi:hypothetical protein
MNKRHWIIFDGDVDPEWVENLNALLDDNKLLTLPNGERLALPPNMRIFFEVQDLKYATLATVSRCGMVWFSEETLTAAMIFSNYLARLRNELLSESERETYVTTEVPSSNLFFFTRSSVLRPLAKFLSLTDAGCAASAVPPDATAHRGHDRARLRAGGPRFESAGVRGLAPAHHGLHETSRAHLLLLPPQPRHPQRARVQRRPSGLPAAG